MILLFLGFRNETDAPAVRGHLAQPAARVRPAPAQSQAEATRLQALLPLPRTPQQP